LPIQPCAYHYPPLRCAMACASAAPTVVGTTAVEYVSKQIRVGGSADVPMVNLSQ
jgi:hypothetical protein